MVTSTRLVALLGHIGSLDSHVRQIVARVIADVPKLQSCRIHRTVRCTNTEPPFSIADAQQVLPLAKLALEAHALGNLKGRDDASFDLLSAFA